MYLAIIYILAGCYKGERRFIEILYTFSSPSTAAGVHLGRSANGLIEWKNNKGKTLKEMQEAEAGGT
ncbi:DUF4357 domain-containing protein [Methanomethylovorans hollandica]|uniref:DUF4357 domain-containing protein n=1 Tax=Methanomethylovorans hollandica TaxID=101192 RepID=UPI000A00723F